MIINLSESAFTIIVYVLIGWLLVCNVYLIGTYLMDKNASK